VGVDDSSAAENAVAVDVAARAAAALDAADAA